MPIFKSLGICLFFALLLASEYCVAWCKDRPTVKQELKDNRYVFVAKVEKSRDLVGPGSLIDGTFYTLRVTENLKGYPELRMEVFSENTTRRFPMDVGSSYLVFVERDRFETTKSLEYFISNCGHSGSVRTSGKALSFVRSAADPEERYFRFPPKLTEARAQAIAEKAARKEKYNLAEYDLDPIAYDDRQRRWTFGGMGNDRVVGDHFFVIVDDQKGSARVVRGH